MTRRQRIRPGTARWRAAAAALLVLSAHGMKPAVRQPLAGPPSRDCGRRNSPGDAGPKGSPLGGFSILVACEYSGRVRDAFRRRGLDAVSCDLLPSEAGGPHIQGDVTDLLRKPWDLVIAHPPCTYLANSGVRWRVERQEWRQIALAAAFFVQCLRANARAWPWRTR